MAPDERFLPRFAAEPPQEDLPYGRWQERLGVELLGAVAMTLVWGHPLVSGGRIATAELAALTVDQCELVNERFTLIAPDDYRHDLLEIAVFDGRGRELARESLYAREDEEEPERAAEA